jgi:hypothetical protein
MPLLGVLGRKLEGVVALVRVSRGEDDLRLCWWARDKGLGPRFLTGAIRRGFPFHGRC